MTELETLKMQRNELNRKIERLELQYQTINGTASLHRTKDGMVVVRIKARLLDFPEHSERMNRVVLRGYDRGALIDGIGEIIEDLKIIQRSLEEVE